MYENLTHNGLKNRPDIKESLLTWSEDLKQIANSEEGPVHNLTSRLGTTISALQHQQEKLQAELKKQRNGNT